MSLASFSGMGTFLTDCLSFGIVSRYFSFSLDFMLTDFVNDSGELSETFQNFLSVQQYDPIGR